MKINREQLIEAAETYTDFQSKYNISDLNEKTIFLFCLFHCFFETADLRSYCGYFLALCPLCTTGFYSNRSFNGLCFYFVSCESYFLKLDEMRISEMSMWSMTPINKTHTKF